MVGRRIFTKKYVGGIVVRPRTSPPVPANVGWLRTDRAAGPQRGPESNSSNTYVAKRLGTVAVDEAKAYMLDCTVGNGDDALETTAVLWVEKARRWHANLLTVTTGSSHAAYVPTLGGMAATFQEIGAGVGTKGKALGPREVATNLVGRGSTGRHALWLFGTHASLQRSVAGPAVTVS